MTSKLENQQFEQSWIEKMLDRANEKIEKAKTEIRELEAARDAMREEPDFNYASPSAEYTSLQAKIERATERMYDHYKEVDKLDEKWHEVFQRVDTYENGLTKAQQRQEELADKASRLGEATTALKEQERTRRQIERALGGRPAHE